ncbi:spliceosome ATPase-activating subunit SPP2 [Aspergillus undulatus]|uniref:spliceosome ATPase-activating subunit SPP2 n=1 Tax=Aspergillus undulatus TaxID=1810928 RepID=UPI003CCCBE79
MSSKSPQDGDSYSPAPSVKPVSLSLSSSKDTNKKTTFNAPSKQNQTLARRPHHTLQHDDDSDEEPAPPAFESVTGFDTLTGKAVGAFDAENKKPLTIPVASGNNWRDRPGVIRRPKGKKNLLPREVQAMQEAERNGKGLDGEGESVGPSMSYGLSFARQDGDGQAAPERDQEMKDAPAPTPPAAPEETKPLTEDETALRALVRESKGETEGRSDLVIESKRPGGDDMDEDEVYDGHNNETRSFRADVAARPESATLDQYNAIPVEEFGAALLRGMGWKEGQSVGKNYGNGSSDPGRASTPHVAARRPGFLGIGAKDVSGGKAEVEFGAWGKAAMRKGSRKSGGAKDGQADTEGVYMPVLMRNKKTGETITEEELSALTKEAKKRDESDDWRERRDRNLERSGRDKDRHRDRDRDSRRIDYDDDDRYESRRNGSSSSSRKDRDRSRSAGDRHSRRHRYDDEDGDGRDGRYYRERGRDRDRDRERRSDRDKDRDRDRDRERDRVRDRKSSSYHDDRYSSRNSSSNTSSRHRDRDRDRDSDRDSRRRR